MSMKVFASALLAASMVAGAAAAADSPYFVGGALGFNIEGETELTANDPVLGSGSLELDQETGLFFAGQVGRQITDAISVDGELLYIWNDYRTQALDEAVGTPLDADMKTWGAMVNATVQLLPDAKLHPYVGAGVGYGQVEVGLLDLEEDDSGVMWQLKAGVTAPVSDRVSLDVGYRYLSLPDFEASDAGASLEIGSDMHLVTFGMRYGF